MLRDVVGRVGALRWAKPAGLAAVAVALMVLGGFGTYVVRGQAPSVPSLGGGGGVGAAAVVGASGSDSLCGQMVFSAENSAAAAQVIPQFPASVTIRTATFNHNCTGPVNTTIAFVANSAGSDIFAAVDATCTGGGCPVTGVPIPAEPNQGPAGFTLVSQGAFTFFQITSTRNFPNLPRGRYTITARVTRNGAAAAASVFPNLTVQGFGPATPALP